MHLLQSTNTQPIFSLLKYFIHSQLVKKREESERRLLGMYLAKKKLERRTKQKKIKLTNKRNTVVLRTSKYENKDDGD